MSDDDTVDATAPGSSPPRAASGASERPAPSLWRRRGTLAAEAVAALLVGLGAGLAAVLAFLPTWTAALLWVAAGLALLASTAAVLRAVFVTEPRLRWGWWVVAVAAEVVVAGLAVLFTMAPALVPPPPLGAGETAQGARLTAIATLRAGILAGAVGVAAIGTLVVNAVNTQLTRAAQADARKQAQQSEQLTRDSLELTRAAQADSRTEARLSEALTRAGQVTDLYTAASQQLGAEKAPVRLAGLYALERLAQSNSGQRQTIVNVWCAYLRMPYTPPPHSDDDAQAQPEAAGWAREEREVRLTAQRLLATHLRPGDDPDHTLDTYWPHVAELDLTGAYLQDLSLIGCRLPSATTFHGASFAGDTQVDDASFTGNAVFNWASFTGSVSFTGTTFTGNAVFNWASITGDASFSRANFTGYAIFSGANCNGAASFDGAKFTGPALFISTSFNFGPSFEGAEFTGVARFDGASFIDDLALGEVCLGVARFDGAKALQGNHSWPANWVLAEEADDAGYHQLVHGSEGQGDAGATGA